MVTLRSWRYCVSTGLLLLGGCCTNHGFILRGDWSIEANRIPFVVSRGEHYQAPDCGPAHGGCRHCGTGGYACRGDRCGAGVAPLGDEANAPPGPAKFHPVPTRPVFTPPSNDAPARLPGVMPGAPSYQSLPEANDPTADEGARLIEPDGGLQIGYQTSPGGRTVIVPKRTAARPAL